MKLEFFGDAFDGDGLLLLYGGDPVEVERLRAAVRTLAISGTNIPLHALEFIESVGNCQLVAISVPDSHGVRRASGVASFDWRLSPSEWAEIDHLLEPFCSWSDAESGTRFQYLNPHDGPEVIYSTARSW